MKLNHNKLNQILVFGSVEKKTEVLRGKTCWGRIKNQPAISTRIFRRETDPSHVGRRAKHRRLKPRYAMAGVPGVQGITKKKDRKKSPYVQHIHSGPLESKMKSYLSQCLSEYENGPTLGQRITL